jgi:choline dehydrogenase
MGVGPPRCDTATRDAATRAFIRAAQQFIAPCRGAEDHLVGLRGVGAASQEGAGMAAVTVRESGLRTTSATSFLAPALRAHPHSLRLETGVHATRLRFDGARCTGVEYENAARAAAALAAGAAPPPPQLASLRPGGEVVLAAGAIGSPHLLLRSGIGAPAQLAAHGIACVAPLERVGENLADHLQIKAAPRTLVPTLNDDVHSPLGLIRMGCDFVMRRRGALTMAPTPAVAFLRSERSAPSPDVQILFGPWSAASRTVAPGRLFRALDRFSAFSVSAYQLRPTSRGSVRLGATPRSAPLIQPNFLSTAKDQQCAVRAVGVLRALLDAPAFDGIVDRAHRSNALLRLDRADDAEALAYAVDHGSSIYHSIGTCAMGASATTAVVDGALRVHGVAGLRVADASVMPSIVSGNTNAATLMIAETAAELMLDEAV